MKIKLLLLFLLFTFSSTFGQELKSKAQTDLFKNIHTNISSLKKTIRDKEGNFLLFGTQNATFSTMDVYVIKLDKKLDTLWTYIISTPNEKSIDDFQNAEVDLNGDIYVHTENFIQQKVSKHFITKLRKNGTLVYQESLEDISLELDDNSYYTSTNFGLFFSHLDDQGRFVLVYSGLTPKNDIAFFRFGPDDSKSIEHRKDLILYNDPVLEQNGYFVNFFYLNGYYYYTSSTHFSLTGNKYVNQLHKIMPSGILTLDITPCIGTGQFLLAPSFKELKSNKTGDILYLNIDNTRLTTSYFTIVLTDSLKLIGSYNDTLRRNKLESTQILPDGSIRVFSKSKLGWEQENFTETIVNVNGTLMRDTVYPHLNNTQVVPIDEVSTALIGKNDAEITDNNWNTTKKFTNVALYTVSEFTRSQDGYYVFSNEQATMSGQPQTEPDNITTHGFKLSDSSTVTSRFSYQGPGSANCMFTGKTIMLSDGSRIVFYSCSKGYFLDSTRVDYVTRLNGGLQQLWEKELDLFIKTNLIKDDNDAVYFGSYTLNGNYYLTKVNPDGSLAYKKQVPEFSDLFLKEGFIYTTQQDMGVFKTQKHNKETGELSQYIEIPEKTLLNKHMDANGDVYFYFGKEVSVPYHYNTSVVIYKNFVQIADVFLGEDFSFSPGIIDSVTKSLYFSSTQNSTSQYQLFKIGIDGTKKVKSLSKHSYAVEQLKNVVYFSDGDKLFGINKETLSKESEISINNSSSFWKKGRYLIHRSYSYEEIPVFTVYNEKLMELGDFKLEKGNSLHLYFTEDDKLYTMEQIAVNPIGHNLSYWSLSRLKLYDFTEVEILDDGGDEEEEEEHIEEAVRIFPNPATDLVNISLLKDKIKEVKIYELNGKQTGTYTSAPIVVTNLASGVYLLKIDTENSKTYYFKIIKK